MVVGDPKQLPPTSFFQRGFLDSGEDNDEGTTLVEEGESILDVASTLYQPVRRLRWHPNGSIAEVVFWQAGRWSDEHVIWPEDLAE